LARVDRWLGVPYFAGFYGRASDVFGAVPSLHVGYPLLIVLYAWPMTGVLGRTLTLAFFASMCFAAVYLDHHWIIDVIVGILYTVVVEGCARVWSAPVEERLVRAASDL
jgi:membrane-associated phospholipid phosphatase